MLNPNPKPSDTACLPSMKVDSMTWWQVRPVGRAFEQTFKRLVRGLSRALLLVLFGYDDITVVACSVFSIPLGSMAKTGSSGLWEKLPVTSRIFKSLT